MSNLIKQRIPNLEQRIPNLEQRISEYCQLNNQYILYGIVSEIISDCAVRAIDILIDLCGKNFDYATVEHLVDDTTQFNLFIKGPDIWLRIQACPFCTIYYSNGIYFYIKPIRISEESPLFFIKERGVSSAQLFREINNIIDLI